MNSFLGAHLARRKYYFFPKLLINGAGKRYVHIVIRHLRPLVESFGLNGTVSVVVKGGIFSVLAMRFRKVRRSNAT